MRENLRLLVGKSSNLTQKICDSCIITTDNTLKISLLQYANHH